MKTRTQKSPKAPRKLSRPDPNHYPKGWDRKRVETIISHYENQTDAEAISEDEAAYRSTTSAMIQVPLALVAKVEKLIARAS